MLFTIADFSGNVSTFFLGTQVLGHLTVCFAISSPKITVKEEERNREEERDFPPSFLLQPVPHPKVLNQNLTPLTLLMSWQFEWLGE